MTQAEDFDKMTVKALEVELLRIRRLEFCDFGVVIVKQEEKISCILVLLRNAIDGQYEYGACDQILHNGNTSNFGPIHAKSIERMVNFINKNFSFSIRFVWTNVYIQKEYFCNKDLTVVFSPIIFLRGLLSLRFEALPIVHENGSLLTVEELATRQSAHLRFVNGIKGLMGVITPQSQLSEIIMKLINFHCKIDYLDDLDDQKVMKELVKYINGPVLMSLVLSPHLRHILDELKTACPRLYDALKGNQFTTQTNERKIIKSFGDIGNCHLRNNLFHSFDYRETEPSVMWNNINIKSEFPELARYARSVTSLPPVEPNINVFKCVQDFFSIARTSAESHLYRILKTKDLRYKLKFT